MKTYIEISISANKTQQELLIPTMIEIGCHGFEERDNELLCYIDKSLWTDEKYDRLKSDLKKLLQTISSNSIIKISEIQETNWNAEWEKTITPIEVGKKLVIKPSWREYDKKEEKILIQIDPKMSFGTGYHETTRLTLQLLEKYIKNGDKVLDIGTGTGILAIAAIKLGANSALGIDNDEWALENANENIQANHLLNKIKISNQALNEINEKFDLITANIMLTTIVDMLPEIERKLKDKGIVLFSGLLLEDEEKFKEAIKKHSIKILEKVSENEWLAFATQKLN
ncbi:MAG: Ribosomal protein L11 methyltransferase [Ignavibacteriae bacterium]|nr:MAG: Ribosomal protein L11 methyltransferase [Ignavibacteriota bacterium]